MSSEARHDAWSAGQNYEHYMGRWSRKIADQFLPWLAVPTQLDWLELGCGTGALSSAILTQCDPKSLAATDLSQDFLDHAKSAISDSRVSFEVADAQSLPYADARFDALVSALTLNFVPDKAAALAQMQRVVKPGGTIAFYVWDYPGGGMGFIDAFWRAAAATDPEAARLDEARRFPFCTPDGLRSLCDAGGFANVEISALETTTDFSDFEAFWLPFTMGAGPAPGYCSQLPADRLEALKSALGSLVGRNGRVRLHARAWAVKGQAKV